MPTKVHIVKAIFFPVVMYGCESWTIKKGECQRIYAFELWCWRRLKSVLNCKEIKSANSKENQPWISLGRSDDEAPILWPPDVKSQLIWNNADAGKDLSQEEKRMTEDGWIASPTQWHEFEQTPGCGEGQGSLVCCSPWCRKELDMTEWLNSNATCILWATSFGKFYLSYMKSWD